MPRRPDRRVRGTWLEVNQSRPLLIGVDVGTTRIKAGLIDTSGRELGRTSTPTVWQRCPTGAEARPADFSSAVRQALAELLASAPPGEVAGIGVTSMAETAVLIGPDGRAVGPAIAWHDRRAEHDFVEMNAALSRATIGRITGLTPNPIPTVAVLRWLMRAEPELRRATRVLSVAEWIAYDLGGTLASELSLASRTGALAIAHAGWWPEVIEWAGLAPALFGELRPAGSSWGRIDATAAGLDRLAGATVTVAGHDHLVAAIGSGITGSSQIMDSCGTAEAVMRAIAADPGHDPGDGLAVGIATGWHALPGCYCLIAGLSLGIELTPLLEQLGATHSAGLTSLDGVALGPLDRGLGADALDSPGARWLAGAARPASAPPRPGGARRFGGPISEVRISGGWSRNPVVRRLKDLDFPRTVYPPVSEAGVRGAGLMAGIAAGVYESVDQLPAPSTDGAPADSAERPSGAAGAAAAKSEPAEVS